MSRAMIESVPSDTLPSYLGTSAGRDTNSIKDKIIRFQIKGPLPKPSISPESSEALAQFSRIAAALRDLLNLPEADELGFVRPSRTSIDSAISTLFPLVQAGFLIPTALDIGTDHDGAIRIVWENGPRSLELVVPYESDESAYFYYSEGDRYGLQPDLSMDATRRQLKWVRGSANPLR
jgi:hypothetical protein